MRFSFYRGRYERMIVRMNDHDDDDNDFRISGRDGRSLLRGTRMIPIYRI